MMGDTMSFYSYALAQPNPIRIAPLGESPDYATAWSIAATASMAAGAYHGYKRNGSVGWALWWGLMGGMFPIITPVIAVAQGFGERAK